MNVSFRCDCCGHQAVADEFLVGKPVRCPKCHSVGVVPGSGRVYELSPEQSASNDWENESSGDAHDMAWTSHPGARGSRSEPAMAAPPAYGAPLYQPPVTAASAPAASAESRVSRAIGALFGALTTNTALAIAGVTSVVFARSVGWVGGEPFPTGAVIGAGLGGLGLVSMVRRVRHREFRRLLFPAAIVMLGTICAATGYSRYRDVRASDSWGLHYSSVNHRAEPEDERFPGLVELSFDFENYARLGKGARSGETMAEALRRLPQSWWPEKHLVPLPDMAPERKTLTMAACAVMDVSLRLIEDGKHRVDLPVGQRDLFGRLPQSDRDLMLPGDGSRRLQYVYMWPNTFRVLSYPRPNARDWTAAVEVTVEPDGRVRSVFHALDPEAHRPVASNGRRDE